ncbi:MAG: ubiquinone/menaquinone biosynthesis methyltransferase [Candidatus Babeliales bacterium]|nr:ubiquinone/menaquinone biosynthesis methyltransferase [Candidatus Babeliales bacterium]
MQKLSILELKKCFTTTTNKRNYNNALFTLIAHKYDWSTRLLSFGRDQSWKHNLIKHLPNIQKPVCLDIACGTGDITFKIAQRYTNSKIFGLDITKEMIKLATANNRFSNVSFVCQDMSSTKFDNNKFDIITGSYALRNASDLHKTLCELKRILKPGGTLAVLDFSKFDNKLAQKFQYYLLLYWGYLWGVILHTNHTTYGYIAESLRHFPSKNELNLLLQQYDFEITKKQSFFFGMIQVLIIKKN